MKATFDFRGARFVVTFDDDGIADTITRNGELIAWADDQLSDQKACSEIERAVYCYAKDCGVNPAGPVADALEKYEQTRDMGQAIEFGKWRAAVLIPQPLTNDQRAQMCFELGVSNGKHC